MSEHFPYHYDFRFTPMWLGAGVLPWRDGVTITDDDRLIATFGVFRVDTPLHNIADAHVTEGYRWWTAIGPRLSLADDGLTFGTNRERGVCVHFREPVPGGPGRRAHSALTVTVDDCEGLVARIGEARG